MPWKGDSEIAIVWNESKWTKIWKPRSLKNVNEKNFNPSPPDQDFIEQCAIRERKRARVAPVRMNGELTNLGRGATYYIPVSSSSSEKYLCKSPSDRAKLDSLKKWFALFATLGKSTKNDHEHELRLFSVKSRVLESLEVTISKSFCDRKRRGSLNNPDLTKVLEQRSRGKLEWPE